MICVYFMYDVGIFQNFQSDSKHKGSCTSLPRDYGNRIDMSLLSAPGKGNPLVKL